LQHKSRQQLQEQIYCKRQICSCISSNQLSCPPFSS
jgi:hypothetical protein